MDELAFQPIRPHCQIRPPRDESAHVWWWILQNKHAQQTNSRMWFNRLPAPIWLDLNYTYEIWSETNFRKNALQSPSARFCVAQGLQAPKAETTLAHRRAGFAEARTCSPSSTILYQSHRCPACKAAHTCAHATNTNTHEHRHTQTHTHTQARSNVC